MHQHFRRRGMSGELGDSIEISEGRHASAVRAEEVKVELMRVNVFAPYEMAMRQKDQVSARPLHLIVANILNAMSSRCRCQQCARIARCLCLSSMLFLRSAILRTLLSRSNLSALSGAQVVKMYGKVTDEHIFVLSSAKQRAEQMLPLRQDVEKQIAAILAREQDENDRRTRREEEAIAEEEGEMEAQVREQEEEMIAKAQDKQLLQKEIQRADGILKNELAKITREREGTKADFNLQRSDEERRAQERVDLLRQAQLREEEDMRRAFAEWKYGRETDANRHRNKLQLSTDAVRIQIERAREEQGDRTDAMVALRQDLDGAQERAGQARDVAAGAREDAARGLEEAEAAAGVARAEVDERELEAAGVVEEGVALQRAKWRELDDVEAKERRLITEKRLEALREAKENMRTIRCGRSRYCPLLLAAVRAVGGRTGPRRSRGAQLLLNAQAGGGGYDGRAAG